MFERTLLLQLFLLPVYVVLRECGNIDATAKWSVLITS